jgi:hypothetical protein
MGSAAPEETEQSPSGPPDQPPVHPCEPDLGRAVIEDLARAVLPWLTAPAEQPDPS